MVSTTEASTDPLGSTGQQLRELVARGFWFMHPRDVNGSVTAVVGVRAHDNVVDVMRLYDECDARVERLPGDEKNVLAPTRVLWERAGGASAVLAELLALPDDHTSHPSEPDASMANGCWVPVGPGTERWLAATVR
jgi:hypothetical protein